MRLIITILCLNLSLIVTSKSLSNSTVNSFTTNHSVKCLNRKELKKLVYLINLYRTNPKKLHHYIATNYSENIANSSPFSNLKNEKRIKKLKEFKNSYTLNISAKANATKLGINGKANSKGIILRSLLFFNWYPLMTYGSMGQINLYGQLDYTITWFALLIKDKGRRMKLLDADYTRIGIAKSKHSKYDQCIVITFSTRGLFK